MSARRERKEGRAGREAPPCTYRVVSPVIRPISVGIGLVSWLLFKYLRESDGRRYTEAKRNEVSARGERREGRAGREAQSCTHSCVSPVISARSAPGMLPMICFPLRFLRPHHG